MLTHNAVMVALLLLADAALAQEKASDAPVYEYGSWRELEGVKVLYVNTGADLELRDEIVARLKRQLGAAVSVAHNEAEADAVVLYEGGVRSAGEGRWKLRWANGAVVKVRPGVVRLLLTFKRPEELYRVGLPYTGDFVDLVVKSYRDANNLGKDNKPRR